MLRLTRLALVLSVAVLVSVQLASATKKNHEDDYSEEVDVGTGIGGGHHGIGIGSSGGEYRPPPKITDTKVVEIVGEGQSGISKEGVGIEKEEKGDIFQFKNIGELVKLIFNPFEFAKTIASHFKLPFDKFLDKIGKGFIFGTEAMLQPFMVTIKLVEKVFVPDACRLKFMCRIGTNLEIMRDQVLKFSPAFLEGSVSVKAMTDGIVGRNCDSVFPNCEPRLKRPYEELRVDSRAEIREGSRSLGEVKSLGRMVTPNTPSTKI